MARKSFLGNRVSKNLKLLNLSCSEYVFITIGIMIKPIIVNFWFIVGRPDRKLFDKVAHKN